MPPQGKGAIVLINLTPNQPKIRGRELSTIRSHNAFVHSSKRDKPRQRPESVDEDAAQVVAIRRQVDQPGLDLLLGNGNSPGPRLPSESVRSDPFDSFPVRANEQVSQAIDHYTTVIASFYGPYLSNSAGISNGCLDVLLPQAINNEYFFHATVAISRTIQLMTQGKSAQHDGAVIFHRGQALVGIKVALSNIDDDLLLMAVMHMVSLDWRLGFVSAMQEHTKGLRRILNLRGRRPQTPTLAVLEMLMTAASNSGLIDREEREFLAKNTARNTMLPAIVNQQIYPEELHEPWHVSQKLIAQDNIPTSQLSIKSEKVCLPLGFRALHACGMVSSGTQSLLESINEGIQQQLRWFHTDSFSVNHADKAWAKMESQVSGQILPEHWDLPDSWLRWGVLAYIFQCYSYSHRRVIGQTVFDRLNQIVRRPARAKEIKIQQSVRGIEQEERKRRRRNCAIWVLMCLAAASVRRQKDQGGTNTGLEGPMDLASTTLMDRVRTLFGFDDAEQRDLDAEWHAVQTVVTQFWCPQWMLGGWEMMWKDTGAERIRAAAYYRVYHHWHSAILPEDISVT